MRSAARSHKVAHRPGELVILGRRDLLAELPEIDREVGGLAGQGRLGILLREGDVELDRVAHGRADDVILEARDEALLTEDERHPLGRAALERDTVTGPDEADHGVIALPGGAILDRPERGVLVTQLVDDGLDLGIVGRLDLRGEREVAVVAELDLRRDLHGGREPEGLALLRLDDIDRGLRQRHQPLLADRLAIGLVDEDLDGLVEDRLRAEDALEHEPGRLARAEARDLRPSSQPANGFVHGTAKPLGRQLELEQQGGVRGGVVVRSSWPD